MAQAERIAAKEIFQHQRTAVQIHGAEGQAARYDRGGDAAAALHGRNAGQASGPYR